MRSSPVDPVHWVPHSWHGTNSQGLYIGIVGHSWTRHLELYWDFFLGYSWDIPVPPYKAAHGCLGRGSLSRLALQAPLQKANGLGIDGHLTQSNDAAGDLSTKTGQGSRRQRRNTMINLLLITRRYRAAIPSPSRTTPVRRTAEAQQPSAQLANTSSARTLSYKATISQPCPKLG